MKPSLYLVLRSNCNNSHLLDIPDNNTCVFSEQFLVDFTIILMFFIVFIYRVMSFVSAWIIITSGLRRALVLQYLANLMWCMLKIFVPCHFAKISSKLERLKMGVLLELKKMRPLNKEDAPVE